MSLSNTNWKDVPLFSRREEEPEMRTETVGATTEGASLVILRLVAEESRKTTFSSLGAKPTVSVLSWLEAALLMGVTVKDTESSLAGITISLSLKTSSGLMEKSVSKTADPEKTSFTFLSSEMTPPRRLIVKVTGAEVFSLTVA